MARYHNRSRTRPPGHDDKRETIPKLMKGQHRTSGGDQEPEVVEEDHAELKGLGDLWQAGLILVVYVPETGTRVESPPRPT